MSCRFATLTLKEKESRYWKAGFTITDIRRISQKPLKSGPPYSRSPYELAAVIAAARWVAEGADGELPAEAVEQIRKVLTSYDAEAQRLGSP